MSTSATHLASSSQLPERRMQSRIIPKTLIYVACGESNGGMVLNASDDGMAISMAIALGDESFSNLHVRMNGLPQAIEVHGRVMWTTKSKKRAGIQLVDLTEAQREQIRSWVTLEGVRDVNLLPRTVAAEPASDSPLPSAEATRAMVFEEPHSTLLDAFGGSAPESLGPTLPERFSSEDVMRTAEPSQGFDGLASGGFRENEWDLASVTMVPRKRVKPEGLSAFALMLLWIAIPSLGIGILIGRRPMEQWLARAEAAGKSFSTRATSQSAEAPDKQATSQDQQAAASSEAGRAAPKSDNTPASTDSTARNSADGTNASGARENLVDPGLFNSMSTQEARAFRSSLAAPVAGVSPKEVPGVSSSREANPATEAPASLRPESSRPSVPAPAVVSNDQAKDIRPAQRPVVVERTMKPMAPPPVPATSNIARNNGSENFPGVRHDYSNRAPRTISVDSGFNSLGTPPAPAESSQSSRVASPPVGTRDIPSPSSASSASSVSAAPARNSSIPKQYANSFDRPGPPVTPPQQDTHSAYRSEISTPATTPPARRGYGQPTTSPSKAVASGVAPSASSRLTSSFAAGSNAIPVRSSPSTMPSFAPVAAGPPLHGVMLVARKDEPYVLKLPLETVAGDRGISIRMQRFVIVPRPGRWHRHGAITKLTIGDLLTEVSPEKPEGKVKPQEGEVVTVRAFLDKYGSVQDLKPVSGRLAMMPRVTRAVRDWQFDQTLMDGKPVESEVNVTVQFQAVPAP